MSVCVGKCRIRDDLIYLGWRWLRWMLLRGSRWLYHLWYKYEECVWTMSLLLSNIMLGLFVVGVFVDASYITVNTVTWYWSCYSWILLLDTSLCYSWITVACLLILSLLLVEPCHLIAPDLFLEPTEVTDTVSLDTVLVTWYCLWYWFIALILSVLLDTVLILIEPCPCDSSRSMW